MSCYCIMIVFLGYRVKTNTCTGGIYRDIHTHVISTCTHAMYVHHEVVTGKLVASKNRATAAEDPLDNE